MMNELNILLLESNQSEALRLEQSIGKSQSIFQLKAATNAADFEKLLSEKSWDVVLVDEMPELPLSSVVKRMNEKGTTVLVATPNIDGETLADLMRAGASDYAPKTNLPRILSLLEQIRSHTLDLKAPTSLVDTLETMFDSFLSFSPDWTITYVNHQTEKFLNGKSKREHIGLKAHDVFSLPDFYKFQKRYEQVMKTGVPVQFEETYMKHWFQVHARRTDNGGVDVFYRDITDQKQAKQNLETSQQNFQQMAETLETHVLYVMDLNPTRMSYISPAYEKIWGRTLASIYQSPLSFNDAVHPEDQKILQDATEQALRGEPSKAIYRIIQPRGQIRWIYARGNPVYNDDGEAIRHVGIAEDITEQKSSHLSLQIEKRKLETIFLDSPSAMAMLRGPQLIVEKINPAFQALLPGKNLLGKTIYDALPDTLDTSVHDLMMSVFSSGETKTIKEVRARVQRTEGGPFTDAYLNITSTRIVDGHDRPYGVYIYALDVTEAVVSRKRVEENKLKLNLALESALMGTWFCDLTTGLVKISSRAREILALTQDHQGPLETAIAKNIHRDDRRKVEKSWLAAARSGQSYSVEFRVVRADGGIRWVLSRGNATCSQDGKPLSFSGVIMDITDRKRIETELQNAKLAAEKANRLKSAFLANMSHEIRTPLGAMIGFADILKDPQLSAAERASSVDILVRNGRQLGHIINDILDISKVESGRMTFETVDVEVRTLAQEVVTLLNLQAREKGITLDLEIDQECPHWICTDPVRLRQILINVVGNAVKFTCKGGVHVRMFPGGEDPQKQLCFEVADTGIGIHKEDLSRLFQVFSQADGDITRKFGGSGLGLCLSKALATALGGDLILKSTQIGKGSVFCVSIDASRTIREMPVPIRPALEAIDMEQLRGLKVLLVEDSPDNQQLIRFMLLKQGIQLEMANNGNEGIQKALSGQHDMVLMDIQMPIMDGYTATEILRRKGFRKPIIALTAHAMSEVRQKCLDVGCNDHLTKPINFKELMARIYQHSERMAPQLTAH